MATKFRDAAAQDQDVQRRFFECEIRVEGERTMSGIAMPYGDFATMPWGEKERFEPGAFGDLKRADVVLNFQHERGRMLARTLGGGLDLVDTHSELRLSAQIVDTTDGNDALALVRAGLVRGFSVEFKPKEVRYEKKKGEKSTTLVIEKAELVGIALVDRPAYRQAKVNPRSEGAVMDKEELQAAIAEALAAQRSEDGAVDPAAIADAIATRFEAASAERIQTAVADAVGTAIEERDAATAAAATAEQQRQEAEQTAAQERQQLVDNAEARADLIVQVRSLLPKDFDTKGKTRKEILVAACGDEVEDSENRTEDYLHAKAEGILERRAAAAGAGSGGPPAAPEQNRQFDPGETRMAGSILTNPLRLPKRPVPAVTRGGDSARNGG